MPTIPTLKEKYAFATTLEERQEIIKQYAVVGSDNWYYYRGLTLLAQLQDTLLSSNHHVEPRQPTESESKVVAETQDLLHKYSSLSTSNYQKLRARFYLLLYTLDPTTSTAYIRDQLHLIDDDPENTSYDQQQQQDDEEEDEEDEGTGYTFQQQTTEQEIGTPRPTRRVKPGDFDPTILTPTLVLDKAIGRRDRIETTLAFPHLRERYDNPDKEQQILHELLSTPLSKDNGKKVVQRLTQFVRQNYHGSIDQFQTEKLTIEQLDLLMKKKKSPKLIENYISKLGDNVDLVWKFVSKLGENYNGLKALILYYKIKELVLQKNQFDDQALFEAYWRMRHIRYDSYYFKAFPPPSYTQHQELIEAYLAGALTENPNLNLEHLDNYETELKHKHGAILLTRVPSVASQDHWRTVLGDSYHTLAEKSELNFGYSTLNNDKKKKDTPLTDNTKLQVKVKNIHHVSIRVFAIDLQQYWRLHPTATSIKVNSVDGLCPTWEKELDYSQYPSIQVVEETIDLEKLAPEVFNGRGAWVIDFVGGRKSCRAIIQKGRLRHIWKDTSAGHLFRILDEKNDPVDAKILYRNECFEPNDDHNILIPYKPNIKMSDENENSGIGQQIPEDQMLILHDEFCEPLQFTCKEENYDLEVNCYVNPESLLPNRQTKVVVSPKLSIYDQPVPLQLLEAVTFTVEAINNRDVKSTFTQHVSEAKTTMEFEFTPPSSLRSLTFYIRGQVKSADGTMSYDVAAQDTTFFTSLEAMSSAYLRTDSNGYFIQVLGKNGEPQRNADVHIKLTHAMAVNTPIEQNLRSNDKGIIRLGKLENISRIEIQTPVRKDWPLLAPNAKLLRRMHQQADTSFKIPGNFLYCNIFQTLEDNSNNILYDFNSNVTMYETHIDVKGLPEGSYQFYLASKGRPFIQMECIVIASSNEEAQKGHWADWLFGKEKFAQASPRKPLSIHGVQVNEKQIVVDLDDFSAGLKKSTRAIVSASAFVPERGMTLSRLLTGDYPTPKFIEASLDTEATFLTGRTLSEEFEYVLNRTRAEKWIGSTLTKPSILIYPDEGRTTTTQDRNLEQGRTFTGKQERQSIRPKMMARCDGYSNIGGGDFYSTDATNDLAFLYHDAPALIVSPNEQGQIIIDRELLGDGNILHIAILQQNSGSTGGTAGEQVLIDQRVLDEVSLELRLTDLCQHGEPSENYVQSKAIAELLPGQELTLNMNHEWEIVDSFEKLFTLFGNMASNVNLTLVEFLKQWPTYTDTQKLKKHDKLACHELNLWIKFKDPEFFARHIQPCIESKFSKTFIDYYLLDDMTTLRIYADSISLYEELTIYEKSLLAKKIPELLPVTLQAFLDAYTPTTDTNFDYVLAGSTLQQQPVLYSSAPPPPPSAPGAVNQPAMTLQSMDTVLERGERLDNLAFRGITPAALKMAMFRPPPPGSNQALFGSGMAQQASIAPQAERFNQDMGYSPTSFENISYSPTDSIVSDGENEEEEYDEEDTLREALRQRQTKKAPFQYTQPTKEWKERGYLKPQVSGGLANVNRFWIDYLESDASGQFLSGNFIHATSCFTEVMFALALSDLPFKSQWRQDVDIANNKNVITAETPCLVFYRQLKEAQNAPPANPSVLLGQNFFSYKDNKNTNQDELDMVDPNNMEPATEYGWHVAISNVSSKKCDIEVTLQIPVGSIPTGNTSYCKSQTLQLQPYSTWQSVVGSFYFPSCGEFGQFPVTVSSRTSMLMGATAPLKLQVKTPDVVSASSSWTTLSSGGSDDQVITYLLQANLEKVDFKLLRWRLGQPEFARRVIDTLRYRRYYSAAVWQYALYHKFPEAIKELLENEKNLLKICGVVFESPLISSSTLSNERPSLLEYSPVIPARQHQLGANPEIRNQELHKSYLSFLDFLSEKRKPSNDDLLVLTIYLVLQERIGDARQVYQRIDPAETSTIQYDYLSAYLETRVSADQIDPATLDLSGVRNIVEKHINCSQLKWRKMFASLQDYIDEVEHQQQNKNHGADDDGTSVMPERQQAQAILTEPVLDFDLGQKEIILRYSKAKEIEIRYYKTDVEVMFSHNPFNRSSDAGWVKPHVVQKIDLNADEGAEECDEEQLESFEVIGIGKTSVKRRRVQLPSDLTHAIVQVNAGRLKRRKPYFAHSLLVHFVESYGMVRVADKVNQRPIAGAYVKVYARFKNSGFNGIEFWKDGYTGLNGVFDYVNVTEAGLDKLQRVEKFSLLISSTQNGALVEEIYPPSNC
ncbi:hypothetical protein BDC45DRAFT_554138 [Circinella umbellata]|nr:hypothetical protein BDC45DRAFT_554138 [Circinella umbellata]